LRNLLDNTCKWAKSQVRATVRSSTARLFIHVEDDGPGIDTAHREAVFDRSQRLNEHMPGSGLGLTIAQELAEAYGGTIGLASSAMGGLADSAELPAAGRSKFRPTQTA
jgi:signal transduction histidine kinase